MFLPPSPLIRSDHVIKFQPFRPQIDVDFWIQLNERKIKEWKLGESLIPIDGYYELDRKEPGMFIISKQDASKASMGFKIRGKLKNYNTLESFNEALNLKELFQSLADQLWHEIDSEAILSHPNDLNIFLLVSFADLKKYQYTFMTGFPCYAHPTLLYYEPLSVPCSLRFHLAQLNDHFFILKRIEGELDFDYLPISNIATLKPGPDVYFAYVDPCTGMEGAFGWPLRHYLLLLQKYYAGTKLSFIAIRSFSQALGQVKVEYCFPFSVLLPSEPFSHAYFRTVTGWTTDPKGRVLKKVFDLSPMMNPTLLAESAIGLNLELMKWRMAPDLDLACLREQKVLLLGAGTLGCHVARVLLSWGMSNLTFVDSGRVSYSNPVRQSLYTHADAIKGLPKAEAAAMHVFEIHPTAHVQGKCLEIPMPDHPMTETQSLFEVYSLIQSSDVIFLLTDSRESRWLPTLLGSFFRKIVMTIALDFNSFLVLRHGVYTNDSFVSKSLGCYFCPDVVSPSNSTRGRTLDQQCTISRPGLSMMASSLGTELLVSLLQPNAESISSGPIPHQIRGYLSSFSFWKGNGESHTKCPACSPKIMKVMKEQFDLDPISGQALLHWIVSMMGHMDELESICGLDLLESEIQQLLIDTEHQDVDDLLEEF